MDGPGADWLRAGGSDEPGYNPWFVSALFHLMDTSLAPPVWQALFWPWDQSSEQSRRGPLLGELSFSQISFARVHFTVDIKVPLV